MSEPHPPGGIQPNPPQWMAIAQGPPAPPGRNGFATASLILGILGVCGLSLIFGLVFGVLALVQIGRTNQAGRGRAITGIVLSLLWGLGLTIGVLILVNRAEFSGSTPTIVALAPGECYTKPPAYGTDATKVSCTAPHDGEVFATVPLATAVDDYYPGDAKTQARTGCDARRAAGSFTAPVEVALAVFYPDVKAWAEGRRNAVCALQISSDKQLTAPLSH